MSIILGLSSHFHDSACCVVVDGRLVAAVQEERFSRIKHDASLPRHAVRFCLDAAGACIADVDAVAYYEDPYVKSARQFYMLALRDTTDTNLLSKIDPTRVERSIREYLGYEGDVSFVNHHLSHAASAAYYSGFTEAAVLVADAVGEFESTSYWRFHDGQLEHLESLEYPASLGLLYSAITGYLGFDVNDGEYKVMGLAAYGSPRFKTQFRELLRIHGNGRFSLAEKYFAFAATSRMYSPLLIDLIGHPPRSPEDPIESCHRDIAASLQWLLEEAMLHCAEHAAARVSADALCLAGGVALNCVSNARLRRDGPFSRVFVPPAAGDAGACLGAAAVVAQRLGAGLPPRSRLSHVALGPSFTLADVRRLLNASEIGFDEYDDETQLVRFVASRLAKQETVGWFHGPMEFGPRALGHRSILADPRDPAMQKHLNGIVKRREGFRPFAPSVLWERCAEHFVIGHPSPFMLETCRVASPLHLPAITHVDGSARVQTIDRETTPRFAKLLDAFDAATGCPILLNTSFNMKDEPIVCSPDDALLCFVRASLDLLVLENMVVRRTDVPASVVQRIQQGAQGRRSGIVHQTYTMF